jgi:hypothetical protein
MSERPTAEELARELKLIEDNLRNTKQQQVRITKAAEVLGGAIKRLAQAEKARFGID